MSPTPTRRKRMRAEDRRRQLLETAAEMFARNGYRGTTTADLAKAAGITEPILYRHFDNKLDLFVTLIDELGREVLSQWTETLALAATPDARLDALLGANPATHERGEGVYRVIFHAMTESGNDDTIAEPLREHFAQLHGFIRKEIMSLQRAHVVRRDMTAASLAWYLMHVAIGYGMVRSLHINAHTPSSGKRGEQRMVRAFVTGEEL